MARSGMPMGSGSCLRRAADILYHILIYLSRIERSDLRARWVCLAWHVPDGREQERVRSAAVFAVMSAPGRRTQLA
jgi:hypothetical protein